MSCLRMIEATTAVVVPVLLWSAVVAWAGAPAERPTPCELSGGAVTPRYEETVAWCADLAASSPLLHYTTFGVSPQGRDLPLVIADLEGRFTAGEHRPSDRNNRNNRNDRDDQVVVLLQACIHAGESCGKDAGMALLRDLVESGDAGGLLEHVTMLFIPIFNVDGHERFSPYGRINQNGPEEMGWRVTARNLNLNRDFVKADTVEMQAWLALFNAWQPDFLIDTHSTDGADYQYAITYGLETHGNLDAGLTDWTIAYRDAMCAAMADDGFPMAPYVSFRQWHDPRSGLTAWAAGPRFSQGYAAVRNRPGLLIETHMLKDYPTRVAATEHLVRHTLIWLNDQAERLRRLVREADARTAAPAFRQAPFPLRFSLTDNSRPFTFLGVAYEKRTSEVTGGDWFAYSAVPETMTIDYFDELEPSATVHLPAAYIVPAEWTEVIDRLRWHGMEFSRLSEAVELQVRTCRFRDVAWQERPYEGRHPVTFDSEPLTETRVFPPGSAVVRLDQPGARIAAHLLEPEAPDALVRWDFFDAVFERVEYVESYVIEEMIQEMLAEQPALADSLAARKAADPEFAANPWAIRYWFYEQTPYYDQRVGIYPVGALDEDSQIELLPLSKESLKR